MHSKKIPAAFAFALALVTFGALPGAAVAAATPAISARCGCAGAKGAPVAHAQKPKVGASATCPVMRHAFTVKADTQFSFYKGKWYAFCCGGCKPKFDANPSKYAGR